MPDKLRLLLFNLATDADDSNLGFATDWINGLAARCQYVDVITMRAGRLAVADNVRVFSVGKEKGYGEFRRALVFYTVLLRLLLTRRYDACFAHMMPLFAIMAAPLLKVWRVPITLWYAHGAVSKRLEWAEKLVDHVVTSSPEGFRLPSNKVILVGQGVDTALFQPAPEDRKPGGPFTIVTVGRIAPVKRLETLLDAVQSWVHGLGETNLRLSIIGEPTEEHRAYAQELRKLVKDLRLEEMVEFPGAVSHERVALEYQEADVMVNLSATGSQDKAVLEAMACGLPVITANEAFRDFLAPWADRLLIPPDAPGKLLVRLVALKNMPPEERRALGLELRQHVIDHYNMDGLMNRLMDVLRGDFSSEGG
jgi:glycosyltransferase involved in cell wall biosynthesis